MVPYRGAGPALNDLLGGHIDAMFDAMPVMVGAGQGGQGHAARGHRHQALGRAAGRADHPGVGLPDSSINGWYGMLAPPGTPPAIAQKLRDEVAEGGRADRRRRDAGEQGMEPRGTQPAECAKYMESELAFYSKIIKDANIKPPQ